MKDSIETVFCALLRVALGQSKVFPYNLSETEWLELYTIAQRKCVLGVAFNALSQLPQKARPPRLIAIKWLGATETIRGVNRLINHEASRFTKLFSEQGVQSAILKEPANARLYPDPSSRQGGILIFGFRGGYDKLKCLLRDMKLISETKATDKVFCHIGFRTDSNIMIEVHYVFSKMPYRSKDFQKMLVEELGETTLTPEGFYSPSIRFALIMQLAHLSHHFMLGGLGLKQYTDYFILLLHSTEADRKYVLSATHF